MVAVTDRSAAEAAFDAALAVAPETLPGADVEWVRTYRAAAAQRFAALGLPTRRDEPFKYTDLRARLTDRLEDMPASVPVPAVGAFGALKGPQITIANGAFAPETSGLQALPEGVACEPLAAALARGDDALRALMGQVLEPLGGDIHPLAALNAGLMTDGAVIRVRKGAKPALPLVLALVHGGGAHTSQARVLIHLEAGAELTLAERVHTSAEGPGFLGGVMEIRLEEGARLHHLRVFEGGGRALFLTGVEAAAKSAYESFHVIAGGALTRNEVSVRLAGSGAHAGVSGAVLLAGSDHGDTTTVLRHAAPGATCREVFHSVLAEKARGVFQGKIIVDRDAQQTDGHQLARALLLSDEAEADVKPELEIYADDVKCSHGATTGALDPEQLFYLRSRGIPEREARALLVHAFLAASAEEIHNPDLKAVALEVMNGWASSHGFEEAGI